MGDKGRLPQPIRSSAGEISRPKGLDRDVPVTEVWSLRQLHSYSLLRSSFRPTYNMAVNLVGAVGRERARVLLEQSFAQYQSDRGVVGLARTIARHNEQIAGYLAQAACDRGDFADYARLRAEISALETVLAQEGLTKDELLGR